MKSADKKTGPPRNYFSRREQLRLLVLVMTLGLVIVMMGKASDPRSWHWLTGESSETGSTTDAASSPVDASSPLDDGDYDTSYQPTLQPVDTETVRIVPSNAPIADDSERYFPGVIAGYLDRVKDNRTHQHPEEAAAWFNLWDVLATNDSSLINDASSGPVTFGQLFEQPSAFRGELVTLKASVRRVKWVPAAKNNRAKIEGYYQLGLRLRNGPDRPIFLYVMKLPPGFPTGDKLNEEIEATGFFYKNWLYHANELSWLAPVVLAKDITWLTTPASRTAQLSGPMLVGGVIVIAAFAALIAWGVFAASRRLIFLSSYGKSRPNVPDPIAALENVSPSPPIAEQLREMAAND